MNYADFIVAVPAVMYRLKCTGCKKTRGVAGCEGVTLWQAIEKFIAEGFQMQGPPGSEQPFCKECAGKVEA